MHEPSDESLVICGTREIHFNSIVIDLKRNSRVFYNGINELSKSIEMDGLLNELIVSERPDGLYQLESGYRRIQALQKYKQRCIDKSKFPYELIRVKITEARGFDLEIINLIDNVRDNLTVYELGTTVIKLKQKFNCNFDELAVRTGYSRSYIYHCSRIIEKCIPPIIKALSRGLENQELTYGKKLTVQKLLEWSHLNPEDQEEEYLEWLEQASRKLEIREHQPKKRVQLQDPHKILSYLEKIREADRTNPTQESRLAIKLLQWCLKQRKQIPFNPRVRRQD